VGGGQQHRSGLRRVLKEPNNSVCIAFGQNNAIKHIASHLTIFCRYPQRLECYRTNGPSAFFQASMPPWMWQADAMPASWAACTAIAERSPKAQ